MLLLLCSFAQVRARKLAEAAATVNELLLKASTLVSSALATDGDPQHVQEVLGQVGGVTTALLLTCPVVQMF